MTIDEIRELIALAQQGNLAELEVEHGDNRVCIRLPGFTPPQRIAAAPVAPAALPSAVPLPAIFTLEAADALPKPVAPTTSDSKLTLVKSPIAGLFYESASPDSEPFVRMGEAVAPGKVLCIIESMKLMNEIEAEVAGTVENRLVRNGQPVEFGEALFAIRTV